MEIKGFVDVIKIRHKLMYFLLPFSYYKSPWSVSDAFSNLMTVCVKGHKKILQYGSTDKKAIYHIFQKMNFKRNDLRHRYKDSSLT
jgi:hypothetical protein